MEHRGKDTAGAVFDALADGRWGGALDLVEAAMPELLDRDPALVRTVADAVPVVELRRRPWWFGLRQYVVHLLTEPAKPPVFPDVDPRVPDHLGAVDRIVILTGRAAALRTRGRFADAASLADDAHDALHRLDGGERARLRPVVAMLLTQWGTTFAAAALVDHAVVVLEEAHSAAEATGSARAARESAGELAWIHAVTGSGKEADRWIERAGSLRARHPGVQFIRGGLALARAYRAGDRLDIPEALRLLDHEGDPFEELSLLAASLGAVLGARSAAADPLAMHSRIEVAVASTPGPRALSGLNAAALAVARSTLHAFQGLYEAALLDLERCPPLPRPAGGMIRSRAGVARLGLGDPHGALAEVAKEAANPAPRVRTEALIVRAAALLRIGNEPSAVTAFREALAVSSENRLGGALALVPAADLGALAAACGTPAPIDLASLQRLATPAAAYGYERLSPQQLAVLRAIAEREHIADAAVLLGLSPNTLKTHLRAAYRRLGAVDRSGALDEAHRRALL
ncbi:helix-turn-helix domain-containing protein [Microbacterium gilvum]|uniref:HTH luxR-type domain-containing protein n=1 Tax=Microbacterium gilvum TaxID=1336204 RepID=A0ABP9AFU7_9MICO